MVRISQISISSKIDFILYITNELFFFIEKNFILHYSRKLLITFIWNTIHTIKY